MIKAKVIIITIFGVLIVVAAYIVRVEWAAGSEWFAIPAIGVAVDMFMERRMER